MAWVDREFDEIANQIRVVDAAPPATHFVPPVDVTFDGDDALVCVELPGVDVATDVRVEVDRGQLVIRGERGPNWPVADREPGRTVLAERRHGQFHRAFALPEHVTGDDVEASYDNGLLTVRVRQVRQRPPVPKRIEVTAR